MEPEAAVGAPLSPPARGTRTGSRRTGAFGTGAGALIAALLLVPAFGSALGAPATSAAAAASVPLTGAISGPRVLATSGHALYTINATGGPAVLPNGTWVGNVTYNITLAAANLTGVSVTPSSGVILNNTPGKSSLSVGSTSETVTLVVRIVSRLNNTSSSLSLRYAVYVAVPYVVRATLYSASNATILPFVVTVDFDGAPVGNVTVPALPPKGIYALAFSYPTFPLSAGAHTFTLSLQAEHGLVRFAGGALVYSETIYVPPPPSNDTVWYVLGGVAFVAVGFISLIWVGARRRRRK